MKHTKGRKDPCCSFCGKTADRVEALVEGPRVYICDECVSVCVAILPIKTRLSVLTGLIIPKRLRRVIGLSASE